MSSNTRSDQSAASDPLTQFKQDLARLKVNIPPPKTAVSYQIAQVIVAFFMILLPLVYVAIVASLAYGVYWYAVNQVSWISDGWLDGAPKNKVLILYIVYRVSCYIVPLLIGVVLLLSMLKPLIAWNRPGVDYVQINYSDLGGLGQLIKAISAATGAPLPAVIRFNADFNASAGPVDSYLSLWRKQLALTLGLPLIDVLSTQELACVIAHELGHFTQRKTILTCAVINHVNSWLASAVYSRDAWDDWLEQAQTRTAEASEESSGYSYIITIIVALIRLGVWLGRRVLWLVMAFGHLISCGISRQMEYDADAYSFAITNRETFKVLHGKIACGGVQTSLANTIMQMYLAKKEVPDNLIAYYAKVREKLADSNDEIIKDDLEESTGIFSSHPSTRDRYQRATAAIGKSQGLVRSSFPAAQLVPGWDRLCRKVTEILYVYKMGVAHKLFKRSAEIVENFGNSDEDAESATA